MRLSRFALLALAVAAASILPAATAQARAFTWCASDPAGANTWPDGQITYNNEWNSGAPQRMCANSPADVRVVAHQPHTSARSCPVVLSYPAVQRNFSGRRVSSFTELRSAYKESQPAYPRAIGEFASDDWLHGPGGGFGQFEIMVWMDNQGQTPAGDRAGTAKLAGAGTFRVFAGGGYRAFVREGNAKSGVIPHLAAYRWLIRHGLLPSGAVVDQEEIGWEICSDPAAGGTYRLTANKLTIK